MTVSSTGSTATPFGFVGKAGYQQDADSGLMLLGHRYYDASTGRFITRDRAKQGRNLYCYAGNNPLSYIDPSGHFLIIFGLAALAVGAAIYGIIKGVESLLVNKERIKQINIQKRINALRDSMADEGKYDPGLAAQGRREQSRLVMKVAADVTKQGLELAYKEPMSMASPTQHYIISDDIAEEVEDLKQNLENALSTGETLGDAAQEGSGSSGDE